MSRQHQREIISWFLQMSIHYKNEGFTEQHISAYKDFCEGMKSHNKNISYVLEERLMSWFKEEKDLMEKADNIQKLNAQLHKIIGFIRLVKNIKQVQDDIRSAYINHSLFQNDNRVELRELYVCTLLKIIELKRKKSTLKSRCNELQERLHEKRLRGSP